MFSKKYNDVLLEKAVREQIEFMESIHPDWIFLVKYGI